MINSTKSPASGAGNVSESRLMLQVGRLREFVCAYISLFLQSERWRCQYSSVYVLGAVTWLRCWRLSCKLAGKCVDVIVV